MNRKFKTGMIKEVMFGTLYIYNLYCNSLTIERAQPM